MIKKIDINKFGLFKQYSWDESIRKDYEFKQLNIIYGRNYSGKTTLARIFKCVEDRKIHLNYQDSDFSITLNNGDCITQNNLADFENEIQIRVYNTDFVKKNLSWLHNDDGTIEPFTILGAKNVELDKEIHAIEEKLGKEDEKKGLFFEQSERVNKFQKKKRECESKKKELDDKLRDTSRSIKNNSSTFNFPTYNITHIREDIEVLLKAKESAILTDDKIDEKKKLLKEESKGNINKLTESKPKFSNFLTETKELLSKSIKPNQPIIDLVNDSLLQEWVRQGIDKHKGKKEKCGFCGSILPLDLWEKLDAHFNKESEELRKEIESQIKKLEIAKQNLNDFFQFEKNNFYVSLHFEFDVLMECWKNTTNNYSKSIDELIAELKTREQDIFNVRAINEISDYSDDILEIFKYFNELIDENNQKTNTLSKDQKNAQRELRLSEVAQFVKNTDYQKKQEEIKQLEKIVSDLEQENNKKQLEINSLNERKRVLEAQAKDESKGAELVNQHLTQFFGHDELKLVAEGESPNMKFKITRGNVDVKNLSEGECSLISFCYFIARIDDEMKDEFNNNKLIIYVDDPISSLDCNHIFFMFSLIDSVIAKPKKYGQLFISTHNLDFLKYLKRLTMPEGKNSVNHFLLERKQKQKDKRIFLVIMPAHIKDFTTEFNYLFNEIYNAYKTVKGDRRKMIENTYNQFYNLPNNMRKFLECYLFYKYPNKENPLENLTKLFDNNIPCLINRIINEYSHLTYIDRGWRPIDVDEVEECAKIIIEKVREKDPDQYDALLESLR